MSEMDAPSYTIRTAIPYTSLVAADMDGDGIKDLVTGKRHWAHGDKGDPEPTAAAVLYWFKLTRTSGSASAKLISRLSRVTTSRGGPAGALMPNQPLA